MPFLPTNQLQTYYEIHGEGEPIVFIHGALADRRMWADQAAFFSPHNQVITYDLRGHGQTGASAQRKYTVRLLADDLHALLTGLECTQFVLCGLSLGGMVAQEYAAAYPQDVRALVLCDTAASMTLTLSDKLQTWLFGWSMAPSVRLMGARRYTDFAFWFARASRGEAWFGQNAAARDYIESCMRAFDTAEMAKVYAMLLRFRAVDLSPVTASTLILNGEHESKNVYQHTAYLKRVLPQAETAVIPGAGHTSNMENPGEFNEVVLHFLKRLD